MTHFLLFSNLIFWKPLVCHCVKCDSFFHSVWDEKKAACFELCVSSVLTENEDIWNFQSSLTLNKGNYFDVLEASGMPFCQL